MGQGFSLATPPAGAAGIDIPELRDLIYEKSIGSARFMKSIRARHQNGVVLVKVLIKPHTGMKLEKYKRAILHEEKLLADVPNALGFSRVLETEENGFLVRQFLYNSLYDRLSTRPFLEDMEKKWLAFQLLCALRDCHARNVYHGDIKTENVLVTSWNWLFLSDFSSAYKPVMLPDSNPADFGYFFDTSSRRTCYLAPERFMAEGEEAEAEAKVTWAMDIFSAGCVMAELFLEAPIFSLTQLYKYRRGELDPGITFLSRIQDKELRDMVAHMMQIDPQQRYPADQYLGIYKERVFPAYFYSFLHQYMEMITDLTSAHPPLAGATGNVGEADQRIDRVYADFDKISYFLGYEKAEDSSVAAPESQQRAPRLGIRHLPVRLNIPHNEHYVVGGREGPVDDGTLIFLTLVVSSLRKTAFAASKLKACDILLAFAERLTDEAKLDRVLPYLMTLLADEAEIVVVTAVRTITQLLDLVRVVRPVNSHVFLEYILPRMQVSLLGAGDRPKPMVRATYASCIGSLAQTADRFLEMAATLKADGTVSTADPEVETSPGSVAVEDLFDKAPRELVALFEKHTKTLIEDADPIVRRAFLSSVPELCMFFGQDEANDIILTHLNTYLNDHDWMLKCAFFDTMVAIAAFLGSVTLEKFILPLVMQALTEAEEFVVQGALHALAQLAHLGMLAKTTVYALVSVVGRLTMHPNIWIRQAAAEFVAASTRFLSPAEARCMVVPTVQPFLKPDILPGFSEIALLDALKKPLSRVVFDQALTWASSTERGDFWKPIGSLGDMTFGAASIVGLGRRDKWPDLSKIAKTEEDEQWLRRLRTKGLTADDEPKLVALREFIGRVGQRRARDGKSHEKGKSSEKADKPIKMIEIRSLGIRPQTVLFEEQPRRRPGGAPAHADAAAPRTIADALLDASMAIDDAAGRRSGAALNNDGTRLSRGGLSPVSAEGRRPLDEEPARDLQARLSVPAAQSSREGSVDGTCASRRGLRHQSSAISLMNGKDGTKTVAETGTTEANAFGEVEASSSPATRRASLGDSKARKRSHASHNYPGNDPSILNVLEALWSDNYPHGNDMFGPPVTPVGASRRRSATARGTMMAAQTEEGWRPTGKLVATFAEHTGAINRVVVSPDQVFFLTGGDDGRVKVWDTGRLERNVAHRSRATYRHPGAGVKVLALCFVEHSHCFVSCASDGAVHVVRVETAAAAGAVRYGKLKLLREYRLPRHGNEGAEAAVWCEHYKKENNSVLVLATNRSRLIGLDLFTMGLLFALENPVQHGAPTCFVVDRRRHWLVLGTSHGVLDLWDLRFGIRARAWGVPGKGPIHRLAVHPTRGKGRYICVAGGTGQGEVTVWDLEKAACREVYRVGGTKESSRGYEAWEVDEDRPEGMLARFATNLLDSHGGGGGGAAGGQAGGDRGVRAMCVGVGVAMYMKVNAAGTDGHRHSAYARDVRHAFIITAGSDKRLRFWDLARVENSVVFSGPGASGGGGGGDDDSGDGPASRPVFSSSHAMPGLVINTERWPKPTPSSSCSSSSLSPGQSAAAHGSGRSKDKDCQATSGAGRSGGGRGERLAGKSTVVSVQQQQMLRSHLDAITDVAVLESPFTMTVSVDRSGVILVLQ